VRSRQAGSAAPRAVPNYVDWRICMGIVNVELFIVGTDEEKIESKSSRLQCVDSIPTAPTIYLPDGWTLKDAGAKRGRWDRWSGFFV